MKKTVFFTAILFCSIISTVQAQVSVTSYSIYALGVNTNKKKKLSVELKSFFNREIETTLFELSGMYNFRRKTYHQFSVGLGINVAPFAEQDPVNSFTLPLQLEIFPLQNLKQLSIIFEVTPEFYVEDAANVRQLWGVRYTFGKK
jgi:hypothetical protein